MLGQEVKHKIGLVYLPGALPCFEDFGNLPTHIVRQDGQVNGKPASEILNMIIIPGGSLVESQSMQDILLQEILKMAESGRFVLGVCSGFQMLAKKTDIGRLSSVPITRQGLGLLDAEFKPLICTDRVKATITDTSFITKEVGAEVTGFHCHTYGKVDVGKDSKTILVSHVSRVNYHKAPQELISGIANKEGNVVGVSLHALIDRNPTIMQSILNALGIKPAELREIKAANAKLLEKIKAEIGISTNVISQERVIQKNNNPALLLITAPSSSSGKTLIVTGVAGALKKRGFRVGILKVGGDIRDTVPALYLIKEPIKDFSSIKIGESGWTALFDAVKDAGKNYNFLIIEGAMSVFTGLLNENAQRPASTAEVAAALGAPTIVVVGCEKEGIEGALMNTLNHVNIMRKLGVNTKGVILNKVRTSYLTDENKLTIKRALENVGVKLLGIVPRLELEGRGTIPEVEIKYEEFGAKAVEAVEDSADINLLTELAAPLIEKRVNYEAVSKKFKNLLTNANSNTLKGDCKTC
ncbi:MAG: AAA family ATPase [Candidatus Bathyarchaeota archaeon]|nr:AAA family ATPase [Candidatus Bathyarchaeota archaeon]